MSESIESLKSQEQWEIIDGLKSEYLQRMILSHLKELTTVELVLMLTDIDA